MTGTRSSFGSATWMRCVSGDPNVPDGNAVAVSLLIGAKAIRWPVWECQVPVVAIAERIGVTVDYVRDVVQLLVYLEYLETDGEIVNGRQVYRPGLPAKFRHTRGYRDYDYNQAQPMNGNTTDNDNDARI